MSKTEKMIKNTFEDGSVRDALLFLTTCVHNAFPEFNFRGIEVVRLVTGKKTVEGKSWNHDFIIRLVDREGTPTWEVSCRRVSHGVSDDKKSFLDANTLKLIEL